MGLFVSILVDLLPDLKDPVTVIYLQSMQNGDGEVVMQVALRVLMAITDRQLPAPQDIRELRRLAPLSADTPIDELACEVIQLALNNRAEARTEKKKQSNAPPLGQDWQAVPSPRLGFISGDVFLVNNC